MTAAEWNAKHPIGTRVILKPSWNRAGDGNAYFTNSIESEDGMKIERSKTFGGIYIHLTGNELATAIDAYLVARRVHISGPRTINVNQELCDNAKIYVDPSGFVIHKGNEI